jgi:ADP-ribosyl-[dinitrogen reductase] hydrolase
MPAREHRVAGAVIGSAVGDALGAPFEFGPPGQLSTRFPGPARGERTEMCGGGSFGWAPGEFTDDTQMALLVGESLVDRDGLDAADLYERFLAWYAAGPVDVGDQTRAVLGSGLPWDQAAAAHHARTGRAAGNGSLMRTTSAAVHFARHGRQATMDAGRRISALTHGDPSAGEGCAIFHELVRAALDGGDPLDAVGSALAGVAPEHRQRWTRVLAPDWDPSRATEGNGAVWPTLGSAVWALRRASTFEDTLRLVVDLGGDTDTVAAVAGGLAGAVYGIAGIPMRWASAVHGTVPGHTDRRWELPELHLLARRLDGRGGTPYAPEPSSDLEPTEVAPGIWAADLDGARRSDRDFAVVSLCRTGGRFGHEVQRFAYLVDDDSNCEVQTVLADVLDDMAALRADGRRVLVHCFGGASRTGLVLRAWLRRQEGLTAEEATARVREVWPYLGLWNSSFSDALEQLR